MTLLSDWSFEVVDMEPDVAASPPIPAPVVPTWTIPPVGYSHAEILS